MDRSEFETKFTEYREFLRVEIYRFRDCVAVYRHLQERRATHHKALNIAPAFFSVVERALWTSIILWVDKLFDQKGQRGLFDFLAFIEQHREWMAISELQRRNNYPDGHWMVEDRVPITLQSIQEDKQKILSLPALKAFQTHRDKFHGHFDRSYSFDRQRLDLEAPITWSDLEDAGNVMGSILNNYASDFDGNTYSWNTLGIDDVNLLLNNAIVGYSAGHRGAPYLGDH